MTIVPLISTATFWPEVSGIATMNGLLGSGQLASLAAGWYNVGVGGGGGGGGQLAYKQEFVGA